MSKRKKPSEVFVENIEAIAKRFKKVFVKGMLLNAVADVNIII